MSIWETKVDVPVLVPRRSDDEGPRDRIWAGIRSRVWWPSPVFEGHQEGGPFNRSMAINTAAKNAGDWSVAVIADADSLVEPHQLYNAVEIAKETDRLVIPHSRWVNVEVEETSDFIQTGKLLWSNKRNIYHTTVSSVLVVPRSVWDAVNGFDERFVGWGWEDVAFMTAVEAITDGPIRMEGSVYHLAHDRPVADTNRQLDPGYIANTNHYRNFYKRTPNATQLRRVIAKNRVTL